MNRDEHIGKRLRLMRELAGISQRELAHRLDINQAALSQIEKRSDILISTMTDYIKALGARLEVDAHFPNCKIVIQPFDEAPHKFEADDERQLVLPIVGEKFPAPHRDIIFSIKPEYTDKIVNGTKTFELRRRFPVNIPSGTKAFIYSTSPIRALTCVAEIGQVLKRPREQIWKHFSEKACITRSDFDNYFEGADTGVAIELQRARPLHRSLGLDELRERFSFAPPQSFLYATPQLRKALEYGCSQIPD